MEENQNSDENKNELYGIKIGMKLDEFIKKLGGYDAISEEKGFMLYQREETYQMTGAEESTGTLRTFGL